MPTCIMTSIEICTRELAAPPPGVYALRMEQPTVLQQNIKALRQHFGDNQAEFAERIGGGVVQSYVSKWERDGKEPSNRPLARLAELAGCSVEQFMDRPWSPSVPSHVAESRTPWSSDIAMVGIQHIDQTYGLGAVFTDNHVEVEVLQFPKVWVETITYSPPALLTWTRGRGDSMFPTICDGDLVLIDRSHRDVTEQDAIWAFTVGDVGSIKRLRVKGDRYVILSDNASIPPDEEPQDFVRIVGRVVFVGAKK